MLQDSLANQLRSHEFDRSRIYSDIRGGQGVRSRHEKQVFSFNQTPKDAADESDHKVI